MASSVITVTHQTIEEDGASERAIGINDEAHRAVPSAIHSGAKGDITVRTEG